MSQPERAVGACAVVLYLGPLHTQVGTEWGGKTTPSGAREDP